MSREKTILVSMIDLCNSMCPDFSQWQLRANVFACNRTQWYECLYDQKTATYKEFCGAEEIAREGHKYILRPNPDQVECSLTHYQPFQFNSLRQSRCAFRKSDCSEEGQILVNNGSTKSDRSCSCDYTKGYVFTTLPKGTCACIPTKEDCSCHYNPCPDINMIMQPDFSCVYASDQKGLPEHVNCPFIEKPSPSTIDKEKQMTRVPDEPLMLQNRYKTDITIVIICTAFYVILMSALLMPLRPHVLCYIVETSHGYKDNGGVTMVIPGDTVVISCQTESLSRLKTIKWRKGQNIDEILNIPSNDDQKESLIKPCLKIDNFSKDDEGIYICLLENKCGFTNYKSNRVLDYLLGIEKLRWFVDLPGLRNNRRDFVKLECFDFEIDGVPDVVVVGQEITLRSNLHSADVSWIKKDEKLSVLDQGEKYTFNDASLIIKDSCLSDAGEYFCIPNSGKDIFAVKLIVIPNVNLYNDVIAHKENIKGYIETQKAKVNLYNDVKEKNIGYIETQKAKDFKTLLKGTDYVIVTGRKGTGKTVLSLDVALEYADIISRPLNTSDIVKHVKNKKVLYIIEHEKQKSESVNNLMKQVSDLPTSSQHKIIVICRKNNLSELQDSFKSLPIRFELLDLDDPLAKDEKRKILECFMGNNDICRTSQASANNEDLKILHDQTSLVTLGETTIETITCSEPWHGFPLTASEFCVKRKNLGLGEIFFNIPSQNVLDTIKGFRTHPKDIHERYLFTILVYIVRNDKLVLSDLNHDQFKTLFQSIFEKMSDQNSDNLVKLVEKEAMSAVNKYLIRNENDFVLINPCLRVGIVLSDKKLFIPIFISKVSIMEIKMFVSSHVCNGSRDCQFLLKLEECHYGCFIKRIVFEILRDSSNLKTLGRYLFMYYDDWLEDTRKIDFKRDLVNCLEHICDNFQKETDKTKRDSKFELDKDFTYFTVSDMLSLIGEITADGEKSWIYKADQANYIILFGIILAAKGNYFEKHNDTFKILFDQCSNKLLQSMHLLQLMQAPIDSNKNTFFHYLTLFGEIESAIILFRITFNIVDTKSINVFNIKNASKLTAYHLAAYLGRSLVFHCLLRQPKDLGDKRQYMERLEAGKSKRDRIEPDNFLMDKLESRIHQAMFTYGTGDKYEDIKSVVQGFPVKQSDGVALSADTEEDEYDTSPRKAKAMQTRSISVKQNHLVNKIKKMLIDRGVPNDFIKQH